MKLKNGEDCGTIRSRGLDLKLIIRIKLFAALGSYNPEVQPGVPFVFEAPEGSTLSDLIKLLRLPEKEVNLFFVNGRIESKDYHLKSQDDVGLFPLIGGG